MKNKFLIGALAMPLLFAACSNEEFVTNDVNKTLDGNMIELAKNFSLVGTKDAAVSTRSGMITWDGSKVLAWYPTSASTMDATEILNDANWDQIGLAWLNETPGSKVYTNYRFQHYGWLNEDETGVVLDKCNDNKVKNGVFFTGDPSQVNQFQKYNGSTYANVPSLWGGSAYDFSAAKFTTARVNPRNGLFNTSNSTIFSGKYLVYYPFNDGLKDIDYLVAKSGKVFSNANNQAVAKSNTYTGDYTSLLAPEFFMVGRTEITGGTQAANFEMGQLSGMIAVKVLNESGATISNIKNVVLYAKGDGFVTSAKLDASKIEDRLSAKQGTALYAAGEAVETSNTLISEASSALDIDDDKYTVFGFAALPATATQVIALVQNIAGETFAATVGNVEVKAGQWTAITVSVNQALSASTLYAFDASSLATAIAKASSATAAAPATINILGEIEVSGTTIIPDYTTVTGYADNDMLVVKADGGDLQTTDVTSVIDCDVIIEGTGCCGSVQGKMTMVGTLAADNTITNYGLITMGDGSTAKTAVVNGIINNLIDPEDETVTPSDITIEAKTEVKLTGEINVAEGTKLTVETAGTGVANEDGALNIYAAGKLTNDGDVVILGNVGTQGQFINNSIVTEKVSAQITGKGVTSQAADAEYICEVNSEVRYNAAINNNPATGIRPTTLVRFVDKATAADQAYTLAPNSGNAIKNIKGQIINFESKLDDSYLLKLNHKIATGGAVIATEIGDLTLVSGGLVINHEALTVDDFTVDVATASTRGIAIKAVITVNGDMNFKEVNNVLCDIEKGVKVEGNVVVTNTNSNAVNFMAATTSEIKGDVICGAEGEMKFQKNSVTTIYGANGFANDGKVQIVPQTVLSGSDVAAIVICRSFTNFGDASKWTNNSYPSVNENL